MARVATLLIAVEFGLPVLHTSTLRFFETSLCSTACMRPELVCAECCDIHAAFVPLPASLVACRLRHPSCSVPAFPTHIVVVEPCRCVMFRSCPSSFSYFFVGCVCCLTCTFGAVITPRLLSMVSLSRHNLDHDDASLCMVQGEESAFNEPPEF